MVGWLDGRMDGIPLTPSPSFLVDWTLRPEPANRCHGSSHPLFFFACKFLLVSTCFSLAQTQPQAQALGDRRTRSDPSTIHYIQSGKGRSLSAVPPTSNPHVLPIFGPRPPNDGTRFTRFASPRLSSRLPPVPATWKVESKRLRATASRAKTFRDPTSQICRFLLRLFVSRRSIAPAGLQDKGRVSADASARRASEPGAEPSSFLSAGCPARQTDRHQPGWNCGNPKKQHLVSLPASVWAILSLSCPYPVLSTNVQHELLAWSGLD